MKFTKMQGLGNDFVVIDGTKNATNLSANQAKKIANRHLGIGCDQILVLHPSPRRGVDFGYQIFNADGSEAAQCGNGARCLARFITEKKRTEKKEIIVATCNTTLTLYVQPDNQVKVSLGIPDIVAIARPLAVKNHQPTPITVGQVSLGNPHVVLHTTDAEKAPVNQLGALIETHPDFPDRTNVGFMQIINRESIRLRVFERGAGETLACGSGACAAVAIGHLQGLLDQRVTVSLNGGQAIVNWAGEGEHIYLTGPAETVFEGEYVNVNTG